MPEQVCIDYLYNISFTDYLWFSLQVQWVLFSRWWLMLIGLILIGVGVWVGKRYL